MPDRNTINIKAQELLDINHDGISEPSPITSITVISDSIAPGKPQNVSATPTQRGIRLDWINPTTNEDGSTCNDMQWVHIYYSSTSDITTSNYDGYYVIAGKEGGQQSYLDGALSGGQTKYYIITALDLYGNEGPASDVVSASASSVTQETTIPDDATGLVFDDGYGSGGLVLGDGIIGIVFQPPQPTWARFDRYRLWFQYTDDNGTTWKDANGVAGAWTEIYPVNRTGYVHKGLSTVYGYRYKATVVGEDGTESSVADTAGGATTIPNASDNSALVSTIILAENIVATNEVRANSIKAGTITADRLSFTAFDMDSNTLDDISDGVNYGKVASTDISAGHITVVSEQASININSSTFGNQGIQLQYNAGTPRAYIGDGASNFLKFDGSNLYISGSVTIGAGSSGISNLSDAGALATLDVVGDAYISDLSYSKITAGTSDASITIGSSGYIQSSNYTAGSSGFKIDGAGNAEFNNITARGALITGSGSSVNGSYLAASSVSADKLYINGDINFAADGNRHNIKGMNTIYESSSASTSYPYIQLNSGNILATNYYNGTSLYLSSSNPHLLTGTSTPFSMTGRFRFNNNVGSIASLSYALQTSWYAWDLSSYVGARTALVLIEIYNGTGSNHSYAIAPTNSNNFWSSDFGWARGCSKATINNGYYGFLLGITSSSGVIYIRSSENQSNSNQIYLRAFF